MIRTEMLLEAAGGRSANSKQAPVPLIAECALLRRKRTAELANRVTSLLRSSPRPRDREPPCARRSDDTEASSTRFGASVDVLVSVRKGTTFSVHRGPPEWLRRESFEGVLSEG